ncbi:MAG: transcription elongation factor Spt5 [Thermoplasmata archaeon]
MIDSDNLTNSMKISEKEKKGYWMRCSPENINISAGRYAQIEITLDINSPKNENLILKLNFEFNVKDPELEWIITSEGLENKKIKVEEISELILPSKNREISGIYNIPGSKPYTFKINVLTPKSSIINDRAKLRIETALEADPNQHAMCEITINLVATIVALKTQVGKEVEVARDLGNKIKQNKIDYVFSILVPGETSKLKGYVFVETIQPDRILSFIKNVKGIKGVVKGEMDISEIMHYLTPKAAVETLQVGNFVELVDGPFKGEKGRIMEIDTANDKIVVELTESLVPIPITVKAGSVRVIEKE